MANFSLDTIFAGGSVILTFIGFYFVTRIWIKWRNIDMDILKARVFLNKKFLETNWGYIFLSGASFTVHEFLDFLIRLNYTTSSYIESLSEVFEFLAMLFLVILAYEWFVLVSAKKNQFL
ncbi:Uncharacterised protein [uncultured archaeon]|nr:Uncharacterised protein [uncultured archaeon]